jgi:uncharacterized damage-inducible protein DinB
VGQRADSRAAPSLLTTRWHEGERSLDTPTSLPTSLSPSEDPTSIATALSADLETEAKFTRALLALAPPAKFAWKPHEKSMSLVQLTSHLAETPAWCGSMLEPSMDFAAMGDYRPFVAKDTQELLATFDRNHAQAVSALRGRDDRFLHETWTMKNGPKVLLSQPRKDVLRSILVHHAIHHRGQLGVYLRMLDVPLPPIYGPTADHPSFRPPRPAPVIRCEARRPGSVTGSRRSGTRRPGNRFR